jgi:hypothetical protein
MHIYIGPCLRSMLEVFVVVVCMALRICRRCGCVGARRPLPRLFQPVASLATLSLPSIPLCDGTQWICTSVFLLRLLSSSHQSSRRRYWPGWLRGRLAACMAAWLSVKIVSFLGGTSSYEAIKAASASPRTSAAAMLLICPDPMKLARSLLMLRAQAAAATHPSMWLLSV